MPSNPFLNLLSGPSAGSQLPAFPGTGSTGVQYVGQCEWGEEPDAESSVNAWGLDEVRRVFRGRRNTLAGFLAAHRKDATDGALRVKEQPSVRNPHGACPTVIVTYVGQLDAGAPLRVKAVDRTPLCLFTEAEVSFEYYGFETTYTYALRQAGRPALPRFHGPIKRNPQLLRPFNVLPREVGNLTNLETVAKCIDFATERMGDYWCVTEAWSYTIQLLNNVPHQITFVRLEDSATDPDPDVAGSVTNNVVLPP